MDSLYAFLIDLYGSIRLGSGLPLVFIARGFPEFSSCSTKISLGSCKSVYREPLYQLSYRGICLSKEQYIRKCITNGPRNQNALS